MTNKIIFTNMLSLDLDKPEPASQFIPDWYKNTKSYVSDKKTPEPDGTSPATIKRCMPVFDAMTAGYIIVSPADVYVSIVNDKQHFTWANFDLIGFHPIEQAPEHPSVNEHSYPKWINYWGVKTPKGYSTLFVQPFHRESPFTILPGIVDTDTYFVPVNFPMVINDPKFEGMIPAGTPIAQVIPFKRDTWKMEIGTDKERKEINKTSIKLNTTFFDKYKNKFRQLKEYK